METSATCPKCNGSGKGEWNLKSSSAKKSISQSKPICTFCSGTGKNSARRQCAQCQGKAKIPCPKCQETGQPKKIITVRADFSPWEKTLANLRIKPEVNCRPQRKLDGSYPIIVKYIETFSTSARDLHVIKWDSARLVGSEWLVKIVFEFKDSGGKLIRQGREFIIENREIKGSKRIDWNG